MGNNYADSIGRIVRADVFLWRNAVRRGERATLSAAHRPGDRAVQK